MEQINTANQEVVEIDLRELAFLYWQKKWVLLLSLLLGAVLAGFITFYLIQPQYSSTSKMYIFTRSTEGFSLSDLQLTSNLTNDYMELIQSRPVVETVIANLGKEYTYEEGLDMLSVVNPDSTRFLYLTVRSGDPEEAMQMANEFARVAKARIAAVMNLAEPNIMEEAVLEPEPVSPSLPRNILIGALIGLFLAAGLYFLQYNLDDTIKSSEDVEKYLGVNALAVIPLRPGEQKSHRKSRLALRIGGRPAGKASGHTHHHHSGKGGESKS